MRDQVRYPPSRVMLASLMHDRIIPSLVGNRKFAGTKLTADVAAPEFIVSKADIGKVVVHLRRGDETRAIATVESLMFSGCSALQLYLEVLTLAARDLGEMWCADECSFGDVTLALASLHKIAGRYCNHLEQEVPQVTGMNSAFVAAVPGQTHIFGATMLEIFFRAAGWNTAISLDESEASIATHLAAEHYDIVCLSAAHDEDVDLCKRLIRKIRTVSLNRDIHILVGGRPFNERPSFTSAVGADETASNALAALETASRICGLKQLSNSNTRSGEQAGL